MRCVSSKVILGVDLLSYHPWRLPLASNPISSLQDNVLVPEQPLASREITLHPSNWLSFAQNVCNDSAFTIFLCNKHIFMNNIIIYRMYPEYNLQNYLCHKGKGSFAQRILLRNHPQQLAQHRFDMNVHGCFGCLGIALFQG